MKLSRDLARFPVVAVAVVASVATPATIPPCEAGCVRGACTDGPPQPDPLWRTEREWVRDHLERDCDVVASNDAGRPTDLSCSDGLQATTAGYDEAGRLVDVIEASESDGERRVTRFLFRYDDAGHLAAQHQEVEVNGVLRVWESVAFVFAGDTVVFEEVRSRNLDYGNYRNPLFLDGRTELFHRVRTWDVEGRFRALTTTGGPDEVLVHTELWSWYDGTEQLAQIDTWTHDPSQDEPDPGCRETADHVFECTTTLTYDDGTVSQLTTGDVVTTVSNNCCRPGCAE